MCKLRYKLFVSFILITLVTVIAVGLLLNFSFHSKFSEYIKSKLNEKHQNVIRYIQRSLENRISPHIFFMNLTHFSMMENVRVQIFNSSGEMIFDSIHSGNMMMAPYRGEKEISPDAYQTEEWIRTNDFVIQVRVISELSDGFRSPNDIAFREAINYSLLGSVGIGLLLAIVFSFFTSSMITRPVTTLKNAAMLISRGDWKTRVKIRTKDELEELGESFNKMARDLEHLENLRRKMTSDLAHELRNPLMSIQSYIEGMLDKVIEADEAHLTDLHEEVQRLTRLIDNLQKLAHLEAKRQVYPTLVRLVTEFEPYFKRIKLEYDKKGVELNWTVENLEGNLDKFIVKEILQNLLDNALKYTPEGGQVSCSMKKVEKNGIIGLQITVKDTGIGIDEKDLPYIFERFYRADPSRARQTGGTGIGLAIIKELVELVAGSIDVKSKLGEGTVFTVFIPFAE
ncbi:hypothetical protein BBF96_06875 [Anoxybacter fermentans]|uniref:histidine kinase n=1 Tax=Anoxybacter fermentans TaxID=1323375 RepID=A0A3S9SY18_9FIRM|nr:HAMP domain-containing sensor histidine kinase [Anoxybacter fermentans]AZR73132.1 hypothetical protein BBF96_06875 [Anoxybacter fermentans]